MEPTSPPQHIATPLPGVTPGSQPKQRYPVLAWLACAACLFVFIGLAVEDETNSWSTLSKWGFYPANRIRDGAYWGLLTSVFVHLEIWHVAFNIYWLYVLGTRLERAIGSGPWLAFFLGSALVSSAAELTFAGTTGIGASGVGYALFGFMWLTRNRFPDFQKLLELRTVLLFVGWLLLCGVLTFLHIWDVGNAAHLSGLLFGAGCGAWLMFEQRRRLIAAGLVLLALGAFIGLFWAPWSVEWTSWRANRSYLNGDLKTAIHWYQRSLEKGQDKVWCLKNRALVYHASEDRVHYQATLDTLRRLDEEAAKDVESRIAETKKK